MKIITPFLTLTLLLFLTSSCEKPDILFQENGSDWFRAGDAHWDFSNEELIGSLDSGSGFVMTRASYSNFDLKLEFYPDSTINSGIFIRCKNPEINPFDCYEINIWDLHPNQDYRTGAIVMKSHPLERVDTINKWNLFEIKCENDRIMAWVNGTLTADLQDTMRTNGFIALQAAETGEIKFRNINIKLLR